MTKKQIAGEMLIEIKKLRSDYEDKRFEQYKTMIVSQIYAIHNIANRLNIDLDDPKYSGLFDF